MARLATAENGAIDAMKDADIDKVGPP